MAGQFIIVDLYDSRYSDIYLDGVCVDSPYKEYFMNAITDSDNIDEWEEMTGLKKKDFRFTVIDLYMANIPNYDCNDYMDDLAKVLATGVAPKHSDLTFKELKEKYGR